MHYYDILPFYVIKYYLYHLVVFPCYNLFVFVLSKVSTKKTTVMDTPIPITTTSLTDQYIQRQTTRLLTTFSINDKPPRNYSENIDAVFYSKSQWTELLKDENNYLEKKWRTKILIENTPRGNVIMYYDAFKMGFAYYSDQTMPYPVLNAVAMKYVLTFFCRDFFMDEVVMGETNQSGITSKHKEDAEAEREEKKQTETPATTNAKLWRFESNTETPSNTKSPFAKFKSYNNVSAKSSNTNKKLASTNVGSSGNEPTLAEPKQTNRFIYLGKTRNVSVLQKPEIALNKDVLSSYMDSTTSGSLHESGIYSIFSPTTFAEQSSPVIPQTPTYTDNKPSTKHTKPLPKPQLTYAEYRRMQLENDANK